MTPQYKSDNHQLRETAIKLFTKGWIDRSQGKRKIASDGTIVQDLIQMHGWEAAQKMSDERGGSIPLIDGWKVVIGDYLDLDQTCDLLQLLAI